MTPWTYGHQDCCLDSSWKHYSWTLIVNALMHVCFFHGVASCRQCQKRSSAAIPKLNLNASNAYDFRSQVRTELVTILVSLWVQVKVKGSKEHKETVRSMDENTRSLVILYRGFLDMNTTLTNYNFQLITTCFKWLRSTGYILSCTNACFSEVAVV